MPQFARPNPNYRSTSFEHYPKWADNKGQGPTKQELADKMDDIRKKMDEIGRDQADMEGYCKVWTYTQQMAPREQDRI